MTLVHQCYFLSIKNKFAKCQDSTLMDQSVPLITVTSFCLVQENTGLTVICAFASLGAVIKYWKVKQKYFGFGTQYKTVFCAVDIFAVFAYLLIKFATVFSGVEASDMFLICRLGCFGWGKMNCTLVLQSDVLRVFFFIATSFKQFQRKERK